MSNSTLQPVTANRCRRLTASTFRAAAFWAAVLIPLTYLPVLHGLVVDASAELFLVLLALNVVCAVIGHEYSPGRTNPTH